MTEQEKELIEIMTNDEEGWLLKARRIIARHPQILKKPVKCREFKAFDETFGLALGQIVFFDSNEKRQEFIDNHHVEVVS